MTAAPATIVGITAMVVATTGTTIAARAVGTSPIVRATTAATTVEITATAAGTMETTTGVRDGAIVRTISVHRIARRSFRRPTSLGSSPDATSPGSSHPARTSRAESSHSHGVMSLAG
jgi:hypothetical protein